MLWTNKNIVFSIITDMKLCAIGKPMRVEEQLSCNSIQSLIGTLSLSTMRSRDSGMWGVVLALPKSILRCKKKTPTHRYGIRDNPHKARLVCGCKRNMCKCWNEWLATNDSFSIC